MFRQKLPLIQRSLINTQKKFISNNRNHNNFDIHLDWYSKFLGSKHISVARTFAVVNFAIFLYVNFRYRQDKKWLALDGISYSEAAHRQKDWIPLFVNNMGARRIDDLIIETGILAFLGHNMEKMHGRPFIIKMFLLTYYLGLMSSFFWVKRTAAKRDRYLVDIPPRYVYDKDPKPTHMFLSQHGFAMSLVYFTMFRQRSLRMLILPLLAADLYIWGPYYSPGALLGLGAAMVY